MKSLHLKKLVISLLATATIATMTSVAQADDVGNSFVLKRIKDRGVINVGHRETSVPFSFFSKDGKPQGYSLDLCAKIVEKVKEVTGRSNLKVKYVPVTSQTRIPLMANGTLDIECGTTTNNLTRQKQVDYLSTTFITGTRLVSKKGSGITEVEDLEGKSVALTLGSTNERAVKAVAKEKGLNIKFVMVKDAAQGWTSLQTGRIDALAADASYLFGLISKSKGEDKKKYQVTGRFLSFDPYGIMVPHNDSLFRRLGNVVLADLMRSGEIHRIYAKWFEPGPTNINMPLSGTMQKAFEIQAFSH